MPTYEYECNKCSHRFEKLQSITAQPLKRCPKCRGKLRRIIHGGAGLVFKGSGFYATDSRRSRGDAQTETATETKTCEGTESPACKKCPHKQD